MIMILTDTQVSKKDQKKLDKKEKKKGKKGGISKADISGPSNFQHLSHLGWDKNKNQFDVSTTYTIYFQINDKAFLYKYPLNRYI